MKELTSRERVKLALNHQEPDRIPVEIGGGVSSFHEELYVKMGKLSNLEYWKQWTSNWGAFKFDERLLQRLNCDFRHLWFGAGGTNCWNPVKIYRDGTFTDFWGIRYKAIDGIYSNIIENPLRKAKTISDVNNYFSSLPDPKAVGIAGCSYLKEEADYLLNETSYAIKGEPMWSHFELCQWIRGMDQFFLDLMENEELAYAIMENLYNYQTKMYEEYFKVVGKYLDLVWISDDLGAQDNLLIGYNLTVKHVKAWEKKRIEYIKARAPQAKVFLHSCGSVYEFIPDLLEIGLDGLNPLQPFAKNMEPERLKKEFGDKLIFMGGLDHQFILSQSTGNIVAFVDRLIKGYAKGGGYIFSTTHVVPASANAEGMLAAFDRIVEKGKY